MSCISQNLLRINGRYYFRQRIPSDLLFITSQKEIKKALGTACPKQAKMLANRMRVIVEIYFNDLRKMSNKTDYKDKARQLEKEVSEINENLIQEQRQTIKMYQALDKAKDINHSAEKSELSDRLEALDIKNNKIKKDLTQVRADKSKAEEEKSKLQSNVDSLIVQNTSSMEALNSLLSQGVISNTSATEKPIKSYSECIEMALMDTKANKKPTQHALKQKRTRMEFFLRVCEDKPITEYTREDILIYKAQIEKLPKNYMKSPKDATLSLDVICKRPHEKMSETTLKKHFTEVKSVFKVASREFPVNLGVLENIVLHGVAAKKRKPWTIKDINALFQSPIYAGRKGRRRTFTFKSGNNFYKDVYFWMPVLALYTGMRREELAKLRVCDFQVENGVPFIDVNEDIGRLKNRQSARKVPIHPDLYKYGLNELVKGRQVERIFHELKLSGPSKDKWGFEYSEDFTEYRKETGLYEEMRDFHSFRHTFASALYDVTKDVLTVCGICGHSAEEASDLGDIKGIKVTTTNYIHRDLDAAYEAIKQLKYEGVDFSNLMKKGKR